MTLYTGSNQQVGAPQFTDENGTYLFSNLVPGVYYVIFAPSTLPTGYSFTTVRADGVSSVLDSDADPITGQTQNVTLAAGDNYIDLDAGIFAPPQPPPPLRAALGDTVWYDVNKNGLQDSGETGVPGVKVDLYREDHTFVATTTTDADGKYLFTDLQPGSYYVKFATVQGYSFTRHNIGSNEAVDSDPLVPWLDVTISDGGVEADLGQPLTFTFFYTNTDATLAATNVVISTTIPTGTSFVAAASDAGWSCSDTAAGSVCTLTLANVPANSSGSVTFTVLLSASEPAVPDQLDLVASLTQNTPAQTSVVTLAPGETNLNVDAGIVLLGADLTVPTPTEPTNLPVSEQPQGQRQIFLPSVRTQE